MVAILVALRLLFPLPSLEGTVASTAVPPSEATRLGAALLPEMAAHPGLSGIVPIADGRDAFGTRMLLTRAAEATIDVQYYIWQADTTGWILLDELRLAAERGVRVRLLVDDNGVNGMDNVLAGLNDLPNAEVRLFNPSIIRNPKMASFLFDFSRLNRRMHNKSFTVDGIASVIGGRNIGDIYFSYGGGVHYFDLDVLAIGQAAADVSTDFDLYWSSASAYPAETILPPTSDGLDVLLSSAEAARESAIASPYLDAMAGSPLIKNLLSESPPVEWVAVELLSDDPAKGLGEAKDEDLLITRLFETVDAPKTSFDLVSAYLIPGDEGSRLLTEFAENGVRTRTLTNSLEATDVPPVHGAYMSYRPDLVDGGVTLLELPANPETRRDFSLSQFLSGSASSLHAKTFAIDNERIFIGSSNFDPRSTSLNTEMGFLIDSPKIAARLSRTLDKQDLVYLVRRGDSGQLEWVETSSDGQNLLHTTDPNTSVIQRTLARLVGWLPIEWML